MTCPILTAHRSASLAAMSRGFPRHVAEDYAQQAALLALERHDQARGRANTLGWHSVAWQRAREGRRVETAARFAERVGYERARPETPEEVAQRNERARLARRLAAGVTRAELELVLDERPLRHHAEAARVNTSTVWRWREAVLERMRDAAREVGL